jgi:hypothetical protein
MHARDLREFAHRRWDLVERLDAEFWAAEKRRTSPVELLRLADGPRLHARRLHPSWPSDEERAEDLEMHSSVARKLAVVASLAGR